MSVFEVIMSPFLYVIKQTFLLAYNITEDYGTSVILLSFGISLLLLPIFVFIERSKKKNDALKLKMAPLIDEIKRVYKGQERFYYIKTIHKQHNYSSFKAVIPILSLLIQIPFFIAAYQYLENYQPLKNVSFLFIKDLSEPDGLFGAIHFLPIFMTVVNLITAWFYTKNGNISERRQPVIVAGIFLVLLFNLPSGLVLYWTMNNVFGFFRLFITNPEVFKRKKGQVLFSDLVKKYKIQLPFMRKLFFVFTSVFILLQLNWAFQNNFNDIHIRILISIFASVFISALSGIVLVYKDLWKKSISKLNIKPEYFYGMLFLAVYFYLASIFYFTGENFELAVISALFLIPVQFIGYIYSIRIIKRSTSRFTRQLPVVFFFMLFYQTALLVSVIAGKGILFRFLNLSFLILCDSLSDFLLPGIVFSFITLIFVLRSGKGKIFKFKGNWKICMLSVLYIAGLIFFWKPIIVYSSFPQNFDFPAGKIFSHNFSFFIIAISAIALLYLLTPKRMRKLPDYVFLVIAGIMFLYGSVFTLDMGTLEVNVFENESNLAKPVLFYLGEASVLLIVATGIYWLLNRGLKKYIILALTVLNVLIAGEALYKSFQSGSFIKKVFETADGDNVYRNKIPFSKSENNVLFFIIDGAQGWYIHDITEDDPSLKNAYDGFVWYPNTVSTSNYTYASVPSLIAGPDYTVKEMNSGNEKTIIQKITKATEAFYDRIAEQGYYFTGNILKYSKSEKSRIDNYLPFWTDDWNDHLKNKIDYDVWYNRLWENALFNAIPLFVKTKVYNKHEWLIKADDQSSSELKKYESVRILPKISEANCPSKSFIYIHSMFTHVPWDIIPQDGKIIRNVHPYLNQKWFMYLFADWLNWMKQNDVYDNTKIILVSDHGPSWWTYSSVLDKEILNSGKGEDWWYYHDKLSKKIPLVSDGDKKISLMRFLRLNPLLMVKDYNQRGHVKEDWSLMCNNDAYYFAFGETGLLKDSTQRKINIYHTEWHNDLYDRTQYNYKNIYEVKENIFDLNNWEIIE